MKPEPRPPPRVVCAANRDTRRQIFLGARHFDQLMRESIYRAYPDVAIPYMEQGFIDQFGNFLTREEAWTVAEGQGQIRRRCGGDGDRLFSENLY